MKFDEIEGLTSKCLSVFFCEVQGLRSKRSFIGFVVLFSLQIFSRASVCSGGNNGFVREDFMPWNRSSCIMWRKNDDDQVFLDVKIEIGFKFFVDKYGCKILKVYQNLITTSPLFVFFT